ncbi:MAG TPA: hypothetical protein VFX02_11110 [Gammaproteobacteria bacterium]|nr:hypothetical protein [Gammaproteobacteria bacterium]
MRSVAMFCMILLLCFDAIASDIKSDSKANDAKKSDVIGDVCLFSGSPPSDIEYTKITRLKLGKGSFGSVADILPKFAKRARAVGADAVINYTGSQRFGFWPWRFIRPVLRGEAIKWNSAQKPDCSKIGGTTVSKVLTTRKAPD